MYNEHSNDLEIIALLISKHRTAACVTEMSFRSSLDLSH